MHGMICVAQTSPVQRCFPFDFGDAASCALSSVPEPRLVQGYETRGHWTKPCSGRMRLSGAVAARMEARARDTARAAAARAAANPHRRQQLRVVIDGSVGDSGGGGRTRLQGPARRGHHHLRTVHVTVLIYVRGMRT